MIAKRNWKLWPSRISDKLNGISGVAGIGGIMISVTGWTGLANTGAATFLTKGGIIIAISAVIYALYKAIPPSFKSPEDFVGIPISITELDNIYPKVLKLAIIGPSRAGKTTLKNRLYFMNNIDVRTQSVNAFIVPVPTHPPKYLAILDGSGEQHSQQFRIAELTDCLCIMLDHNTSDTETTINSLRLQEHSEFLKQIRYHLAGTNCPRKKWIEILINKRDLWENAIQHEKESFKTYYDQEVNNWKSGSLADSVTITLHSNEDGNDIAKFMSKISDTVRQ